MAKNTKPLAKMLAERTSISPVRVIKSDSLIERSLDLVRKGVIFGWKRELYIGAGLYNLKLYSPDFVSICNELSFSDTSRKRYLRIGKRISEIIHSVDSNGSFISEEDIESFFTNVIKSGERLTLRGLDKASSSLPAFSSYLKGEFTDITEKEPVETKPTKIREVEEVPVWDEIERVVMNAHTSIANVLKGNRSSQETSDFQKYRSVMHVLGQVRLAVSAYQRGEIQEAQALLTTNDFELV
jgi:hypothetical protein